MTPKVTRYLKKTTFLVVAISLATLQKNERRHWFLTFNVYQSTVVNHS
jgi:hypothetical protein